MVDPIGLDPVVNHRDSQQPTIMVDPYGQWWLTTVNHCGQILVDDGLVMVNPFLHKQPTVYLK